MDIATSDIIVAIISVLVIGAGLFIGMAAKPVQHKDENGEFDADFDPQHDHHFRSDYRYHDSNAEKDPF